MPVENEPVRRSQPCAPAVPQLTLYELAGADPGVRFSPYCWKIRMALAHKGLQAERIPWRFTEKAALVFSGQDRVPVLVDNGTVVADSWRIALHLENAYPGGPSLFGAEAAVPLTSFSNAWVDATLVPFALPVILLDIYEQLSPQDRDYFRTSREQRFGRRLKDVAREGPQSLATFRQALAPLRMCLQRQSFIAGERPAYSDYCVFGVYVGARGQRGRVARDPGSGVRLA